MLLVASPFLLLVAAAVKLETPRAPVFFLQERVGLERRKPSRPEAPGEERRSRPADGRIFKIYKFRTMIPDAEKATGPVWAAKKDPRVTQLGSLLRRLRIDEIPQLMNVVQGHMRLIGPRPERPCFVGDLSGVIPEYTGRLKVPPGITGLAQIEREYDANQDDVRKKVKYDLYYVQNKCALLDLKILIKTVEVMLRGRGAH
jgi:lipopolysaccharide/colanic/teichoic acid biosynthesis glycosyltransferase